MKKSRKADEKNSLEQLLLRWKRYYDENKTKVLQFVLVFAAVVVIVALLRSGVFKGSNKNDVVDTTYYAATQASFAGVGAPDADAFAVNASAYGSTVAGGVLHVDAGEAYVRRGFEDVAKKQRYSAGTKLEEGEKLNDPKASYASAVEEFEKATACSDADIKARAYYGEGAAQESIASVSENDEAVVAALDAAKTCYEKVASASASSPYASLVKKRLESLANPATVDYYKAIAHAFVTLPDPADTPSITTGDDSLEVGAPVDVNEEFNLNEDSEAEKPADDAAPAAEASVEEAASAEEAAPAEETTTVEEAPAAEESAPVEEAPAEEAPAAEATEAAPAE